jgi:hypothetical protein
MIVTLRDLKDGPQACINGMWVPARPINYRHRYLFERLREAWLVFTGKYDPFVWPEDERS